MFVLVLLSNWHPFVAIDAFSIYIWVMGIEAESGSKPLNINYQTRKLLLVLISCFSSVFNSCSDIGLSSSQLLSAVRPSFTPKSGETLTQLKLDNDYYYCWYGKIPSLFTGFYTSQVLQDFFHQQYHAVLPPLDLLGIMSLIPLVPWGLSELISRFSRLASVRELVGQDDQSGVWHQLWSSSLDIKKRAKFLLDFLWHFLGHHEPELS